MSAECPYIPPSGRPDDTHGYPQSVWDALSDPQRNIIIALQNLQDDQVPIDPTLADVVDLYKDDEQQ